MAMRINELKRLGYEKLYNITVERYVNYFTDLPSTRADVNSFSWSSTPEGHEFWACVNAGNFSKAKDFRPELFEITPEYINGVKSVKNGLLV